ncbi:acyl-CoA dehydrogenase family protein [Conexibacter sp. SYSU D00693]|uniref:acyl-CoA dehydrogenase family protein n=1 Tax=Conexibacter sp. SYSU D00693 TaxID=2812560 RepID=UPI00196A6313|nr:acyl-CoA dehydrogenase family protein [Conexibacter sp. SYSU D00693]
MTATAPLPVDAAGDQVPRLAGLDLVGSDLALVDALRAHGAAAHEPALRELGARAGSTALLDAGFDANEHPPRHVPYDRSGARVDDIAFHPSWHRVLRLAVEAGVAGGVWADERPGAHVARAAGFIAIAQAEAGVTCPIAMTCASVPALRLDDDVAATWVPLVTSGRYDTRPLPAHEKEGALVGMALTERAGGSDVRRCTTTAVHEGDGAWRVTGEKWFVSAVQSDALFVLAQTGEGLSCLLVPRRRADGSRNGMRIDRLKDKLGNRSNPTAEVELRDAEAQLVGEAGHGVRAIMRMIAGTRLDCVLGSAAVMRLGTSEAIHWCTHRSAFGRRLVDQPAMTAVLADLALESEAAAWSGLALARAAEDAARGDATAAALRRLALPALKLWVCKRAPAHLGEALECLGGFGYVEESRLPRAYREAPLMSVWEGSGNVQALDVVRALAREPESAQAVVDELDRARGASRRLDAAVDALRDDLRTDGGLEEARAREVAGRLARCFQAAQLVRHAPSFVADAFCATRLGDGDPGMAGALPRGLDVQAIVDRAAPQREAA